MPSRARSWTAASRCSARWWCPRWLTSPGAASADDHICVLTKVKGGTTAALSIQDARRSADRRGVQNAAGAPELVQPPRNAEFRAGADVALIDLAVIADVLDDAHRPILGQVKV